MTWSKDPEFVADPVAHRRDFEGGKAVQIAGCEPAQASVSKPRLFFLSMIFSRSRPRSFKAFRASS